MNVLQLSNLYVHDFVCAVFLFLCWLFWSHFISSVLICPSVSEFISSWFVLCPYCCYIPNFIFMMSPKRSLEFGFEFILLVLDTGVSLFLCCLSYIFPISNLAQPHPATIYVGRPHACILVHDTLDMYSWFTSKFCSERL